MGGNAFATPGPDGPALFTPRMSPEIYAKIHAHYRKHLESFFDHVVTPAEAPAKPDHGDVDFMVSNDDDRASSSLEDLPQALGARRVIRTPVSVTIAVAWTDVLDPLRSSLVGIPNDQDQAPEPYAQIDIHLYPIHLLEWAEFHHAWGDFWQILGLGIRPYGLTANEQGLNVRVEEIECVNNKASMLFLTRSPSQTLDFLGLDAKRYCEGFQTEQYLFDFIRGCRLFAGLPLDHRESKSRDRQKMKKRSMYRHFFEQTQARIDSERNGIVCPSNDIVNNPSIDDNESGKTSSCSLQTKTSPQTGPSRQSVFEECLNRFQKQTVYQSMIDDFRLEIKEKAFWSQVTSALSVGKNKSPLAIRSLKRWVRFEDGLPVLCSEKPQDSYQVGMWMKESRLPESDVVAWAVNHWQEAYRAENSM